MDQENQPSIDINLADAETLTQLQGVGRRLANRIIEARPFASINDLTRVRGISEKDVERLQPFLSISGVPDELEVLEETEVSEDAEGANKPEEIEAAFDNEAETEIEEIIEEIAEIEAFDGTNEVTEAFVEDEGDEVSELEAAVEAEAEAITDELEPVEVTPAPAAQPAYVTRGGACSLVLLGGLVTLILAIIITLGILSSFNNGQLSYVSPNQITALQSQVESLSTQANILAEDIDSLRTRMDNLEALSGQVSAMQTEFEGLQEEIADLQAIVAANQEEYDLLTAQIEVINEDINELGSQTERSEGFLEGLRALLENLLPENPEVEETP